MGIIKTLILIQALFVLVVGISWVRMSRGNVQQDNYLTYATAMLEHDIEALSRPDWRLLPGLPWLLMTIGSFNPNPQFMVFGGYVIMWAAFVGSAWLMWLLSRRWLGMLGIFFPPVMLAASTIVGTEMPAVFLLLLGVYLVRQKQYWLASLVFGVGMWVRLILIIPGMVLGLRLWLLGKKWDAVGVLYVIIISMSTLGLWNLFVFGDVLVQLRQYVEVGRATLSIGQLLIDIPRALEWGWWRQVVSGIFYVALLIIGLRMTLHATRYTYHDPFFIAFIRWVVMGMVLFVFSLGPTPFLEEFPRFLVPVWPLLWLLTLKRLKSMWVLLLPLVSIVVVLL